MTTTSAPAGRRNIQAILQASEALDMPAFEAIYHHYMRQLISYASSKGARDPEGIAHLALFDAYRAFNRKPIRDEPAFRAYLYRATANHTIGEARRTVPEPAEVDEIAVDDEAPEVVTRLWLDELVEDLPEAQREVVERRFYEDLTVEQAADQMGRGSGAIHQLQHRAVNRLRRAAGVAVAVLLLVVGFLAWRRGAEGPATVDTGPAERGGETVDPDDGVGQPPVGLMDMPRATSSTTGPSEEIRSVDDEQGAVDPDLTEDLAVNAVLESSVESVDESAVDESESAAAATAGAGPKDADTGGDGTAGAEPESATTTEPDGQTGLGPKGNNTTVPPTTAPTPTSAAPNQNAQAGAGGGATATPPVDQNLASVVTPADTMNRCEYWYHQPGSGTVSLLLFDPQGVDGIDDSFTAPGALLLVSEAGPSQTLNLSGSPIAGTTAAAHGWTTVGTDDALSSTYEGADGPSAGWTVRYEPSHGDGWVNVYQLARVPKFGVMWLPIQACANEALG